MTHRWKQTGFARRLGLRVPIVQGPFGSGLSAADLVVAVSEAGGLGSFGAHHLDGGGIARIAQAIRGRTPRPFALNLWIPFEDADEPVVDQAAFERAVDVLAPYFAELGVPLPQRPSRFTPRFAEQIEAVLEARPAVFSFVYGIPSADVLERCRERNILTLGAATTPQEATALEHAGVDAVVATGFEAGGHRVSFMRSAEESLTGTLALVPQVVDTVQIPVIAAGGIADGRGIAAAMMLGAQAAQIGTAFLACDESAATQLHRDTLHSTEARHTMLSRSVTGRLARGVTNRFLRETQAARGIAPYPVQAWLTAQLKEAAVARGRADLLALWSGQSAALITERSAGQLMQKLERETDALLA